MSASFVPISPCLSTAQAQAMRALVAQSGPYSVYVAQPIAEGLGQGLVRRHDAALNHFRKLMAAGQMESLPELAARTNLFRGTFATGDVVHVPGVESLLHHAGFTEVARGLLERPLIVPCELHANLLLPGQELAVHTDTPEYRGLSKREVPEWLLVVMGHSGLFERWRMPIATAVAFFSDSAEGDFILFPEGRNSDPEHVEVRNNTAVVLNTDALFHGVERVGSADAPPPPFEIGMHLSHRDDVWHVGPPDGEPVLRYAWDEVRVSIQWKAHGYRDAAEQALVHSHTDDLTYDAVLTRLVEDLRERGKISGAELPDDTELALLMIDTYIQFPG